jgi:hypothetical protein
MDTSKSFLEKFFYNDRLVILAGIGIVSVVAWIYMAGMNAGAGSQIATHTMHHWRAGNFVTHFVIGTGKTGKWKYQELLKVRSVRYRARIQTVMWSLLTRITESHRMYTSLKAAKTNSGIAAATGSLPGRVPNICRWSGLLNQYLRG